jgi:hypothetical protein
MSNARISKMFFMIFFVALPRPYKPGALDLVLIVAGYTGFVGPKSKELPHR